MKNAFILLSVLIYSSASAQQGKDIGLRVTTGFEKQISFDYRWQIKDSLRLVLGADYSHANMWPQSNKLVEASNNSVTFESYHEAHARPNLRFGIERPFKKHPNVYLGGSVIAGYTNSAQWYSQHTDTLNENGIWEMKISEDPDDFKLEEYRNHFLSTGVMVALGWEVPIKEKFIFNINVAQTLVAEMQVGPAQGRNWTSGGLYRINANASLGLGLRYRL